MKNKTLIFIPTYNEKENAPKICEEIMALGLDADLLFIDDNSPDGTGFKLEKLKIRFPRLLVHHRTGKLGIGSAHLDGIKWAYKNSYNTLITMDCDFTHLPSDIPILMKALSGSNVAVGSRFILQGSLAEWSVIRKIMTQIGHLLTYKLLGITQDASGAFRAYNLRDIPVSLFENVRSYGYAFFFESLFLLSYNKYSITEIPITLPARASGNSKMSLYEIWRGVSRLLIVSIKARISPDRYRINRIE